MIDRFGRKVKGGVVVPLLSSWCIKMDLGGIPILVEVGISCYL